MCNKRSIESFTVEANKKLRTSMLAEKYFKTAELLFSDFQRQMLHG